MMPQRSAGKDFYCSFASAIAAGHLDAPPPGLRISQAFGQTGLAGSNDARPPDRPRPASGWRVEQASIQTQPGDHADPTAHRTEQLDGGVTSVGHTNDLAIGKPSRRLEQQLAAPVRKLLMPSLTRPGIPRGRRQCH